MNRINSARLSELIGYPTYTGYGSESMDRDIKSALTELAETRGVRESLKKLWKVEKAEEHILELEDADGWYQASVKWDGCVDYRRFHNVRRQDRPSDRPHMELEDYLHICELDDEIARLQEIKEKALAHFGKDWPC